MSGFHPFSYKDSHATSLLSNQIPVRSVSTKNIPKERTVPAQITEAFRRGLSGESSTPLGCTPIIGHISLTGQLHGQNTQYFSGAKNTPANIPANPIPRLTDIPPAAAAQSYMGISAREVSQQRRAPATIRAKGIIPCAVKNPVTTVTNMSTREENRE